MTYEAWDARVTTNTHVMRHIVAIDGKPYWRTLTRQPDGTYEETFEIIELED